MPLNQVRVNPPTSSSASDQSIIDVLAGKQGDQIVSELHGKYYTQNYRGNVYQVTTVAAGLAVPISNTTAPTVMLWNPTGSGKNAVLLRFSAAYASGTSVATPIGLVGTTNAGNVTATAAAITAFNQSAFGTNLFSGIYGASTVNTSVMKSSANGTNTVTAGTWLYTMGGESALVAATAMNPYSFVYDFDGSFILAPGAAIWVAGTAASGALLSQTLVWEEVPV